MKKNLILAFFMTFSITVFGQNTFYGTSAGNTTLTGIYNAGFGNNVLKSITTGGNNMAIGFSAGTYITTGYSNSMIGSNTGTTLMTGGYNTFIGNYSGFQTGSTDSFNTYIGGGTGTYLNGSGNTMLGGFSGRYSDANFSVAHNNGTNLTFIGYRVTAPDGLTNATAIGYQARVTTSNSLILGNSAANVGIGVTAPRKKLEINGAAIIGAGIVNCPSGYNLYVSDGIITEKITVAGKTTTNWADFVFSKTYKLKTISEVESFINKNGHLPEIPTTKDVQEKGIDLAETQIKLLQKIEELTLYIIQQEKRISKLEKIKQ